MIALFVVWNVTLYMFMVGMVYSWVLKYLGASNTYDHGLQSALVASVWPFSLPVAFGMYVARTPARWEKAAKEKARLAVEAVEAARRRTLEIERDCEVKDAAGDPVVPPSRRDYPPLDEIAERGMAERYSRVEPAVPLRRNYPPLTAGRSYSPTGKRLK